MINEGHLRSTLKFFYFLLLSDELTLSASIQAVRKLQKKAEQNPEKKVDSLFIETVCDVLEKYKSNPMIGSALPTNSDWKIKNPQALIAWKEFMRRSDPDYRVALVLRYVLGVSISSIAEGLRLPEGTIYFRLNRGLETFSAARF